MELSNILKELIPKLNDFFPSESAELNKICLKICDQTSKLPIFCLNKNVIYFEDPTSILLKIQQLVSGILAINENPQKELKLIDSIKQIIEFVCRVDMQKVKFF